MSFLFPRYHLPLEKGVVLYLNNVTWQLFTKRSFDCAMFFQVVLEKQTKMQIQLYQQQKWTLQTMGIAHWHDPVQMAWVSFKKIWDFNDKFELRTKILKLVFTLATLTNLTMTSALCWGVVLLSTIHWIHWESPLKRAMERSSLGLSLMDPDIA